MVTQSRKTYYRDENISLEYEISNGDVLVHSYVNKFSSAVFRKALETFAIFLNECQEAGVKRVFTVTPNPKYARLFGGVSVNSFEFIGKEYEVIEWDLTQ